MVAIITLGLISILANIPLAHQFNYVECYLPTGGKGIRIEVADDACIPAYLKGYLAGFTVFLNTLLPAFLQILMNAYIIKVMISLQLTKAGGNVGKVETWIALVLA